MRFFKRISTRRWLIGLGVVIVTAVGFYVGLWTYSDWLDRQEWVAACATADRLDPGWRWEELVAALPTAPEGRNSAEFVAAAARRLSPANKTGGTNRLVPATLAAGHFPQRRLSPQTVAGLDELLFDEAAALAEIDRIRDCSGGRLALPIRPLLLGPWPQQFEHFEVVRRLIYPRLALRAERGEADGALDDFRLVVAVAGPAADAPILLANLIAAAEWEFAARGLERVLAQGEPSPAALDAGRRFVAREVARTLLLPAFRGERAWIADTLFAMDDGRLTRNEVAKSGIFTDPVNLTGWKKADDWITQLTGADLRRSKGVSLFRYHTQVIEWLKESPDGLKTHEAEWAALRSQMTGSAGVVAGNLARYVADARAADARFRCAAAALAAEQFRRENGHWPAALGELVPKRLSAVPRDPYDLKPLRLARRPDGIVIYSVGEDGTDEGGAIASDGAATKAATDIGLRLWDVNKRCQPPVPPNDGKVLPGGRAPR